MGPDGPMALSAILPKSGKIVLIAACLVLFRDAFPVNAPNQGAIYQDVKVEVCDDEGTQAVVVRGRLYQEIATHQGHEEREIKGWDVIKRHVLKQPEGAGQ